MTKNTYLHYASQLNQLLEKKLEGMEHLLELTKIGHQKISEEKDDVVNSILNERQKEMDQIDEIDRQFLSVFSELKSELKISDLATLNGSQYPELASLKSRIADIQEVANETMVLEKENEKLLKMKMDSVRTEMNMVKKGRQGLKAYESTPTNTDGYFVDKKK